MTSPKHYSYCFTLNNPTEADLKVIKSLETDPRCKYYIIGREVGESGTPHLQGYVYFKHQIVFATCKKLLPRAHIEPALGSPDQNITYCSKDGDTYEWGVKPLSQQEKGKRGREYWDEQLGLAKRGRIEECDPKLQITHHNALNSIAARAAPMPDDLDGCDNEWYYGDTGCGKSYKARTENPGHYLKMCNKWWDGYNNEDVAILEDFDKSHHVLGHHLKIWADRYAFPAEIKGGKVNLRPKKIIVTSNYHPRDIWPSDHGALLPIERRFKITHFSSGLVPSP